MNKIFIRIRENKYRGFSYSVFGGFYSSSKEAMKAEDTAHRHTRLCDYCPAKWTRKGQYWERVVDFDGAHVIYHVKALLPAPASPEATRADLEG